MLSATVRKMAYGNEFIICPNKNQIAKWMMIMMCLAKYVFILTNLSSPVNSLKQNMHTSGKNTIFINRTSRSIWTKLLRDFQHQSCFTDYFDRFDEKVEARQIREGGRSGHWARPLLTFWLCTIIIVVKFMDTSKLVFFATQYHHHFLTTAPEKKLNSAKLSCVVRKKRLFFLQGNIPLCSQSSWKEFASRM